MFQLKIDNFFAKSYPVKPLSTIVSPKQKSIFQHSIHFSEMSLSAVCSHFPEHSICPLTSTAHSSGLFIQVTPSLIINSTYYITLHVPCWLHHEHSHIYKAKALQNTRLTCFFFVTNTKNRLGIFQKEKLIVYIIEYKQKLLKISFWRCNFELHSHGQSVHINYIMSLECSSRNSVGDRYEFLSFVLCPESNHLIKRYWK